MINIKCLVGAYLKMILFFKSNKLICKINTKDEDHMYRPNGNLSEFYENLRDKLPCKIIFDNKDNMMTIFYPKYEYGSKGVGFEIKFKYNDYNPT